MGVVFHVELPNVLFGACMNDVDKTAFIYPAVKLTLNGVAGGDSLRDLSTTFCLEDGALKMGDKVHLRMTAVNVRCNARFFGSIPGESIMFILEDQEVDNAWHLFGRDVCCEHDSGDVIVVFNGKIKRFDINPFHCLHLSYPNGVRHLNVARDVRFNVNRVALLHNVSLTNPDDVVTGKLLNLSQGGGLVVSSEPVGFIGDEVEVFMVIPCVDRDVKLKLKAKLRHVRNGVDHSERPQFYSGFQFINISHENSIYIKSYLFDSLKQTFGIKALSVAAGSNFHQSANTESSRSVDECPVERVIL